MATTTTFFFKESGFSGRGQLWLLVIGAHRDINPEGAGTVTVETSNTTSVLREFYYKMHKTKELVICLHGGNTTRIQTVPACLLEKAKTMMSSKVQV